MTDYIYREQEGIDEDARLQKEHNAKTKTFLALNIKLQPDKNV